MITPRTPLILIASFAVDGRVFRAFDHLIAAGVGEILLAPMVVADGDLRGVIDYCPVPWEEAWTVLDTPLDEATPLDDVTLLRNWPRLARLHRSGWQFDQISIGNSSGPTKSIDRVAHASGLRFVRIRSLKESV
jgi:hypothetical protein